MQLPKENDPITQEQVNKALNLSNFGGTAGPGMKGWHYGLFEPWAMQFGYLDGRPIYASTSAGYHIYYLNLEKYKAPIILKPGQKPQDYGIQP